MKQNIGVGMQNVPMQLYKNIWIIEQRLQPCNFSGSKCARMVWGLALKEVFKWLLLDGRKILLFLPTFQSSMRIVTTGVRM